MPAFRLYSNYPLIFCQHNFVKWFLSFLNVFCAKDYFFFLVKQCESHKQGIYTLIPDFCFAHDCWGERVGQSFYSNRGLWTKLASTECKIELACTFILDNSCEIVRVADVLPLWELELQRLDKSDHSIVKIWRALQVSYHLVYFLQKFSIEAIQKLVSFLPFNSKWLI